MTPLKLTPVTNFDLGGGVLLVMGESTRYIEQCIITKQFPSTNDDRYTVHMEPTVMSISLEIPPPLPVYSSHGADSYKHFS